MNHTHPALVTPQQQLASVALALLMSLATVMSMAHLADGYQVDARLAMQQSAPAAQQVVVVGRRGAAG